MENWTGLEIFKPTLHRFEPWHLTHRTKCLPSNWFPLIALWFFIWLPKIIKQLLARIFYWKKKQSKNESGHLLVLRLTKCLAILFEDSQNFSKLNTRKTTKKVIIFRTGCNRALNSETLRVTCIWFLRTISTPESHGKVTRIKKMI